MQIAPVLLDDGIERHLSISELDEGRSSPKSYALATPNRSCAALGERDARSMASGRPGRKICLKPNSRNFNALHRPPTGAGYSVMAAIVPGRFK
jgi:hypothetical protein